MKFKNKVETAYFSLIRSSLPSTPFNLYNSTGHKLIYPILNGKRNLKSSYTVKTCLVSVTDLIIRKKLSFVIKAVYGSLSEEIRIDTALSGYFYLDNKDPINLINLVYSYKIVKDENIEKRWVHVSSMYDPPYLDRISEIYNDSPIEMYKIFTETKYKNNLLL